MTISEPGDESLGGSAGDEPGGSPTVSLRTILQNFLNLVRTYEEGASSSDPNAVDPYEVEFQVSHHECLSTRDWLTKEFIIPRNMLRSNFCIEIEAVQRRIKN